MAIQKTTPWSIDEVKTFLCLVADDRIQRELDGATRNEKIYQEVSKLLAAHGYQRTFRQCREKLKKLKSDYRFINGRSDSYRKNWKWFIQMDAMYGHRPASHGREDGIDSTREEVEPAVFATGAQKISFNGMDPMSGNIPYVNGGEGSLDTVTAKEEIEPVAIVSGVQGRECNRMDVMSGHRLESNGGESGLDLATVKEEVETVVIDTGTQKRGRKRSLPNQNVDAFKSLIKLKTERAKVQIRLAEEHITLTQLQQTKARLEIRLLKERLQKAGLSTKEEL